jgi:Protein of unknown function (DUF1614)
MFAYPVPGVGIAVPVFVLPIVTAVVAVLIARKNAAALAYISGSLSTLIGADLLNLDAVGGLGAPVASIGGVFSHRHQGRVARKPLVAGVNPESPALRAGVVTSISC